MVKIIKPGDFTGLASNYSKYRPDYSKSVLDAIKGLIKKNESEINFVDVGAGTGIWSRMVYESGVKNIISVEPNEDMYKMGIADSSSTNINWQKGSAENTNLKDNSADWITMASSFHWADFNAALKEFHRVLVPNGVFTAIWNPRLIEVNPILLEIENHLKKLKPNLNRVSSGRSGITENLTEKLNDSIYFKDVIYVDGRHIIKMDHERYLGAWNSVNDLQVQLGESLFKAFIEFIKKKIEDIEIIEATYLTRSWTARKK